MWRLRFANVAIPPACALTSAHSQRNDWQGTAKINRRGIVGAFGDDLDALFEQHGAQDQVSALVASLLPAGAAGVSADTRLGASQLRAPRFLLGWWFAALIIL